MNYRLLRVAALACTAIAAHAHDYTVGAVRIDHPYARATAPGQMAGGGYLTLQNKGGPDTLLSVRADVSQTAALHSMRMEGEVMRMREVGTIALPAGQTVKLEPGGLHIMFMGLKAPLKEGSSFPMTLRFERAGEVVVQVSVEGALPQHVMKR